MMKKRTKFVLALAASPFLAGCVTTAQQPSLTLYSNPIGATITENKAGAIPQMAPVSVIYNKGEQQCLNVLGFTAVWPSGATADTGVIELCGQHSAFQFVISRPSDAPNYHIDTQFAASLQMNQQMQQQQAAMMLLLNQGMSQGPRRSSPTNLQTRCVTYGNITRCDTTE